MKQLLLQSQFSLLSFPVLKAEVHDKSLEELCEVINLKRENALLPWGQEHKGRETGPHNKCPF
jgi:hypothetical protein